MAAKVNARPSRQDEELPVRPRALSNAREKIRIDSGPCGRKHFEKTQAINEEIKSVLRDIRGQIDQLRQFDV
jgi:hypothetical protein